MPCDRVVPHKLRGDEASNAICEQVGLLLLHHRAGQSGQLFQQRIMLTHAREKFHETPVITAQLL
ncbi:hypothetical protein, partial [Enterococcus faecium]|uniref:hypothetical protein n=1 Tax=Enterococcus faecium TaxID=1352 RepID=UPI003F51DE2E